MVAGNAQFRASDVGASLFYGRATLSNDQESLSLDAAFYGVSWYPRYILSEGERGSISVGIPLTIGLSGSYNSREGGAISFGLDAPIAVDYNFGLGAFAEDDGSSRFGGFVGAGFGYTTTTSTTEDDYNSTLWNESDISKARSYGPMAHGGIRFGLGENGNQITLKLSYKKGLEKEKYNFFGATFLFGF